VEPLVVLILLPMAVGALAEAVFRDAKRASLVAAFGAALGVGLAVQLLDRNESWSWVAALLVSPLPIALAIATVLFWYGRTTKRMR
jgi:phosphate/sulfate permease